MSRAEGGGRWWVWLLAAAASVTLLVTSLMLWGIGERPTLRAMAASEAMTDEQARVVAENTVRVWFRERNAGHLANLQALSCPDVHDGPVAREIEHLRNHDPLELMQVVAVTGFTRKDPIWTVNVIRQKAGSMFELRIDGGELRVCQVDSAPVP
ncbi:hypothetical protein DE4585_03923 [Mycobacteroides salmoniphilum]|uniref:Uncharacterized protein n=1 Tax=Mycobacteroides salmoniphilum TaxID=404941 RepID=A0A4R8RU92_9MYCO|nr:hypothetical protein [Mycobacteroides salmoniphilum]TDZ78087.1 hypothetical protein DE4585_03923 [Mycobacteroides salmoniphilum]